MFRSDQVFGGVLSVVVGLGDLSTAVEGSSKVSSLLTLVDCNSGHEVDVLSTNVCGIQTSVLFPTRYPSLQLLST